MNETLQPYIEKLLSSGAKTIEDVAKFIETQTPELANEIIRWGAISEITAPANFMFLMIICSIIHLFYKNSEPYKSGGPERDWYPPLFVFNLAAFIGFFILFLTEIVDVLYPLIAPRLYILEKISSLIK